MRAGTAPPPEVVDTLASLDGDDGLSLHDFLHDNRVFAELCAEYDAHRRRRRSSTTLEPAHDARAAVQAGVDRAGSLPRFRALHAVSTGYAGALGALVHRRTQAPFILTEHGIYTKERHGSISPTPPGSRTRRRAVPAARWAACASSGSSSSRRWGGWPTPPRTPSSRSTRGTARARSPTARDRARPASSRTASTCNGSRGCGGRPARPPDASSA